MAKKDTQKSEYGRNLLKSVKSSSAELLRSITPNISTTIFDSASAARDAYDSARDFGGKLKKQEGFLKNSSLGKTVTKSWSQLKSDIKTGNFTGDLTNELSDGYDDFDDWGDDEWGDSGYTDGSDSEAALDSYDSVSTSNKLTANLGIAVTKGNIANIKAIQNMTSSLGTAQLAASQTNAKEISHAILYQTNVLQSQMTKTNSILSTINDNLVNMMKFQNENVSPVNQAIMDYIKGSSEALKDLTDMIVMPDKKEKFKKERARYEANGRLDFLSSGFDIQEYAKFVKKNFMDTEVGSMLGFIPILSTMLAEDNGTVRPLKHLINSGVKKLIPKNYMRSIGRLDNIFASGLEEMMYRLGDMAWDYEKNGFVQFLGQVFGAERQSASRGVNMANYHKDTMMWNGLAQQALVTVIPSYLAKIESSIAKIADYDDIDTMHERRYDYERGQFLTMQQVMDDYDKKVKESFSWDFNGFYRNLVDAMNKNNVSTEYQKSIIDYVDQYARKRAIIGEQSDSEMSVLREELGRRLGSFLDDKDLRDNIIALENSINGATKSLKNYMKSIETGMQGSSIYKTIGENYSEGNVNPFIGDALKERRYSTYNKMIIGGGSTATSNDLIYDEITQNFGYTLPKNVPISNSIRIAYDKWKRSTYSYDKDKELEERRKLANICRSESNSKLRELKRVFFKPEDETKRNFIDSAGNKLFDLAYGSSYKNSASYDPDSLSGDTSSVEIGDYIQNTPTTIRNALKYGQNSNYQNTLNINGILSTDVEAAIISLPDDVKKSGDKLQNLIDIQRQILSIEQETLSTLRKVKNTQLKSQKLSEGHWKKLIKAKKIVFQGDDGVDMTESEAEQALKAGEDAAEEVEAAAADEEDNAFIRAIKSLEVTAVNTTAVVKAFGMRLFGKKGSNSVTDQMEQDRSERKREKLNDYLFDEEKGKLNFIPKTWGDIKKKAKYHMNGKSYTNSKGEEFADLKEGEYIGSHLKSMQNWVADNIKKNRYGENYENNEKYQKDKERWAKFKEGIFGKEKKPEQSAETISEAAKDAADTIRKSAQDFADTVFGNEEERNKNKEKITQSIKAKLNNDWKKTAAKVGAGLVIGGGLGALASTSSLGLLGGLCFDGGPLAGAILGGSLTLLSSMEGFKKFLLGDKDDDGKRTGGVITKNMQETFKKFLPAMVGGAVVGGMKGMFFGGKAIGGPLAATKGGILLNTLLPGGVLGGAILGLGVGILKNSDRFKDALFGKDRNEEGGGKGLGKIWSKFHSAFGEEKSKRIGRRGVKGLAIGAVSGLALSKMGLLGMALGPGGPIGMGIIGLGLGIASASDKFNDYLFGSEITDANGNQKRSGGLVTKIGGMLQTRFFRPVADKAIGAFEELGAYTRVKLFPSIQEAFYPVTYAISTGFHNIGDAVKSKFETIAEDLGKFMKKKVGAGIEKVVGITSGLASGMFDVLKWAGKGTINAVSLPFHAMSMVSNLFTGKDRKKYFTRAFGKAWEKNVEGETFKDRAKGAFNLLRGGWREEIEDDYDEDGNLIHDADSIRKLFGFKKERKEAKNDYIDIIENNKAISRSNKIAARLAKSKAIGYNPNVVLSDDRIARYRNLIMGKGEQKTTLARALGVSEDELEANLSTNQDIMDYIFKRSDWQKKIKDQHDEAERIKNGEPLTREESAIAGTTEAVNKVEEAISGFKDTVTGKLDDILESITGGAYKRNKNNHTGDGNLSANIVDEANLTEDEIARSIDELNKIRDDENRKDAEKAARRKRTQESAARIRQENKDKEKRDEARLAEEKDAKKEDEAIDETVNNIDDTDPAKQKKGFVSSLLSFFGNGGLSSTIGRVLGLGMVGVLGKKVLLPLATDVILPFLTNNVPKLFKWIGTTTIGLASNAINWMTRKSTGEGGKTYETEQEAAATGKNYAQLEDGSYFVGESNEYIGEDSKVHRAGNGIQNSAGKLVRKAGIEYVKHGTKGVAKMGAIAGTGLGAIAGATTGGLTGGLTGIAKAGIGAKAGGKLGNAAGTVLGKGMTAVDVFAGTTKQNGLKAGLSVTGGLAKKNLCEWMLALCTKIEGLLTKVNGFFAIFKGTTDSKKAGLKVISEMKRMLTESVQNVDEKMAQKATDLIATRTAKEGTEDAAGVATAGVLTIVFAAYDLATGFFEADKLFNVESDEVTLPMRIISKYMKCLMGLTTITSLLDVALEIVSMITGFDAKCWLATGLHNALLFFIPGGQKMINDLDLNQDKMVLETMVYNYTNGDNLSTNNYSEMKDPGWFKKIWNKVTGKDKKFSEYDQMTEDIINAGFYIKDGKIYSPSGREVDVETAINYINSSEYNNSKLSNREFNSRNNKSSSLFSNTSNASVIIGNQDAGIQSNGMYGVGPYAGKAIGYGYSQGDPRWGNFKLGKFPNGKTSTMATGGCGPTALASIAGANPLDVAKMAKSNGMLVDGGASASLMTSGANKLGLDAKNAKSSYYGDLQKGKPVVLSGVGQRGASPFTKAGHIVTATGVTKNGGVVVNDPMTGRKSVYSKKAIDHGLTGAWSYSKKKKAAGYGNALGYGMEDYRWDEARGKYVLYENGVDTGLTMSKEDYDFYMTGKNEKGNTVKNTQGMTYGKTYDQKEKEQTNDYQLDNGKYSKELLDVNTKLFRTKYRNRRGLWWFDYKDPAWSKLSYNGTKIGSGGGSALDLIGLATLLSNLTDTAITPSYVIRNLLPRMGKNAYGGFDWNKLFDSNHGIQYLPELTYGYWTGRKGQTKELSNYEYDPNTGKYMMKDEYGTPHYMSKEDYDYWTTNDKGYTIPDEVKGLKPEEIKKKYKDEDIAMRLKWGKMSPSLETNYDDISSVPGMYFMRGRAYQNSPFSVFATPGLGKLPLMSDVKSNTPTGSLISISSGNRDVDGNPIAAAISPSAGSIETAFMKSNLQFLKKGLGQKENIQPVFSDIWKLTNQNNALPLSDEQTKGLEEIYRTGGDASIDNLNEAVATEGKANKKNIFEVLTEMIGKIVNIGWNKITSMVNGESYNRIMDDNGNYLTYTDSDGNIRYKHDGSLADGEESSASTPSSSNSSEAIAMPNSAGYANKSGITIGGVHVSPYLQAIADNSTSPAEKASAYTLAAQNASEGNFASVAANDRGAYSVGLKQWRGDRSRKMLEGYLAKGHVKDSNDIARFQYFIKKAGSPLSEAEGKELSALLKKYQNTVEPYQYEYGVKDNLENEMKTPFKMLENGELLNARSMIVPGAIANTGPAYLSGGRDNSGNYWNWRETWKNSPYNKRNASSEVDDVASSLMDKESAWGTFGGYSGYISKARDFAKNVPASAGFGTGAVGYGVGANDVLNTALAEVGTKEQPADSNKVKYNTEFYGKEVSGSSYPWCVVFPWWVFKHSNASKLFYDGKPTASSTELMNWSKRKGRFIKSGTGQPAPGDVVFFNFKKGPNANDAEHTGLVLRDMGGENVRTIEGNTGSGNDANGGAVQIRERTVSKSGILGYYRPEYDDATDIPLNATIGANAAANNASGGYSNTSSSYTDSASTPTGGVNGLISGLTDAISKVTDIANERLTNAMNGKSQGYGIGDNLADKLNIALDADGVEDKLDILIQVAREIAQTTKDKNNTPAGFGIGESKTVQNTPVIVNTNGSNKSDTSHSPLNTLRQMHDKVAKR